MTIEETVSFSGAHIRTVGERLTFLRRRGGLTLNDAADRSGVSKSELSRLENDSRRLKDHHIEILARLYGIDAKSLRDLLSSEFEAYGAPDQFLPCYDLASLIDSGIDAASCQMTRLPFALKLGDGAYMIALEDVGGLPVPARSRVIVDPTARPVLGDLVANVATWKPPLMILARDDHGNFLDDMPALKASKFHKAVACFSQSHFG